MIDPDLMADSVPFDLIGLPPQRLEGFGVTRPKSKAMDGEAIVQEVDGDVFGLDLRQDSKGPGDFPTVSAIRT